MLIVSISRARPDSWRDGLFGQRSISSIESHRYGDRIKGWCWFTRCHSFVVAWRIFCLAGRWLWPHPQYASLSRPQDVTCWYLGFFSNLQRQATNILQPPSKLDHLFLLRKYPRKRVNLQILKSTLISLTWLRQECKRIKPSVKRREGRGIEREREKLNTTLTCLM